MRIERKRFRSWLRSHSASDIVGLTRDPDQCPIASYLHAKGIRDPRVYRSYFRYTDPGSDFPGVDLLPRWAVRFQEIVDDTPTAWSMPVTASAALKVLDTC